VKIEELFGTPVRKVASCFEEPAAYNWLDGKVHLCFRRAASGQPANDRVPLGGPQGLNGESVKPASAFGWSVMRLVSSQASCSACILALESGNKRCKK